VPSGVIPIDSTQPFSPSPHPPPTRPHSRSSAPALAERGVVDLHRGRADDHRRIAGANVFALEQLRAQFDFIGQCAGADNHAD